MFNQGQRTSGRNGLLLGWDCGDSTSSYGFHARPPRVQSFSKPIVYTGDANLMTCAPTGMGKGRGALIPNALLYPGPLIAIDPKGELAQVTGRQRERLGNQVIILDPFHTITKESGKLNPFDLLDLPGSSCDSDSEMLATLLAAGHLHGSEPYWSDMGTGLTSGLIAHIATSSPRQHRHFGQLRDWLYHHDMDYAIATALDGKAVKSRLAYEQFVAYLAAPDRETRPCIRTTACSFVGALGSDDVRRATEQSSFRLVDVVEGRPLSIFIVIPPEKLESHKSLLRLWVGTLLTAVTRRKRIPAQRTLFLLDECAQLGTLPALRQAVTLLRGSGLQVWTFWQDFSQLRSLYPQDWQTMVNNSAAIQVFGINNNLMAKEWAELFGKSPAELLRLDPKEALVLLHGEGSRICQRPDYLHDELFQGLFAANERFALHPETALGG